jgi:hypothetical protein
MICAFGDHEFDIQLVSASACHYQPGPPVVKPGQAAYDLLAPPYGWFTEGFETADLKEAEGLLAELG